MLGVAITVLAVTIGAEAWVVLVECGLLSASPTVHHERNVSQSFFSLGPRMGDTGGTLDSDQQPRVVPS